ncbi:MAG: N-acetylmuramoyl-L-alanine amidase, partial [Candidatus Marinimicrobia bacterium]|nr:N-acetylmuramoyl-L-alanine amidase [Candidatus Neomarinimicrobiota bacterium]
MKRIVIILFSLISLLAAQDLSGKKLYINAGHGGHDSNDRPPINDAGYWESEGNLTRALVVETLLKNMGATVVMSRRHNRISDGAALSSLGSDASNQNCDWFHSIHTNASGGNSTLMLYSGFTGDPIINVTQQHFSGMLTMSNYMGNNLKAALQTTGYTHAGDYSFYGTGHNYLGVFRYLNIPGTLSESSFHDYWPNTYRLQNLDNRINDAWAITLAFVQYYGKPLPDFVNLAGIVRTQEETTNYEYINGTNDQYKPIDSLVITIFPAGAPDSSRTYFGNTTMYVDKYTPQWSQITTGSPINPNNWAAIDNSSDYDYYTNGANNNHGYNRNNGFYLFDSLAFGSYTLVFEAPGYWPDTTQITTDNSKFFWTRNFYMTSSLPPFVKQFNPSNNEPEHPAWEPIVLTFSHEMDTAGVRSGLSIDPPADLIFGWSGDLKVLTLSAAGDSLEVETDYTLTLDADTILGNRAQHLDGNGDGTAGDDFVLRFTTSPPDIDAPKIETWYPVKYARFHDLQPIISFCLDEIIDLSGGIGDKFALIRTTGDDIEIPTVKDVYTVNGKTVVSLFPTEELVRGNSYTRYMYSGIGDLFGNVTPGNFASGLIINTSIPWYADTLVIDAFSPTSISSYWRAWNFSGSNRNLLGGSVSVSTDVVNHGNGSTHSLAIYYKFDPEAADGFMREWLDGTSVPAGRRFNSEGILQAWVFGDGSNNRFRFAVDDPSGTGASEVSPWYDLNFTGWQLMKWDLRDGETGEWPGVSDGVLNGTLNFDSFQIEYIDSTGTNEGTIYIEDLMFLTPGGVAVAETGLAEDFALKQNYPNPFNPATAISYRLPADGNVDLSVYDLNGRFVA